MSEQTLRDSATLGLMIFLVRQEPGTLSEAISREVIRLLRACWDDFEGADAEKMHAGKLSRAEGLTWKPPVLSFFIERHGGTVLGSSRAALQRWDIDTDGRTARCCDAGYRQVRRRQEALNVKPLAAEIGQHICAGFDHTALKWSDDRSRVRVRIADVIPDDSYKQTIMGRRKRFRAALRELLPGWREVAANQWERSG